ncbi:hypothetical protein O163_03380 [Caldanaerobacter subterraneus subsp. yonseiensis KB-1]|uniref:Uncharacterized protein n=1 Tax=Caldanaerobacter subterraneus subsp. yonseiensis KB-1 TaxID=1388761 RepID=U5CXM6_CALSX|nr:hypothetical protein [Caldanaerobacter subterraneus]ERM92767.1 hypothetical protein O163_03380 [Caldanaerobacter subterraneus subsp. yonseiensis KB-1]
MNKKVLSIVLIILLLAGIISWHLYEYINIYSSNPSKMWSRDLFVGEKNLNAPSPLFYDNGKVYVVWGQKKGFFIYEIYPELKKAKEVLIENFNESSVKTLSFRQGILYWLENDRIKSFSLSDDKEGNFNIKANDFKLTKNYIVLCDSEGIKLFNFSMKQISFLPFNNISQIDAVEQNHVLHISFLTDDREENKVYYVSYDLQKNQWLQPVEIDRLFQTSTSRMDNVKVASDKNGAYVFYLITAKNGTASYYAYFPHEEINIKKTSKIYLPSSEVISFDVVSVPEGVGAAFSTSTKYQVFGPFTQSGVEIVYALFREGTIHYVTFITKEGKWASAPYLISTPEGLFVSWIETGGFSNYLIKAASTNQEFAKRVGGIREVDVQNALSLLVYSLASGVFLGFIMSFITALPSYGWLLIVMFLEPKNFKSESPKSFYIALILYSIAKYLFYPPRSIKAVATVSFPYNLMIIPVVTVILAFVFTKMYFKGKLPSSFAAFTFLWVIDSLITNVFYSPFMIK